MFCIQKRQAVVGCFIIFLGMVLMWSKTIQESPKSYSTRAGGIITECRKAGLYDIPVPEGLTPTPGFVSDYYTLFCHDNENNPIWNGSLGSNARCLTATLVCGSKANCTDTDCIMNVSNSIKCLYKEVPMDICKRAGVVNEEQMAQNRCVYGGAILSDYSKPYSYDPTDFCVRKTDTNDQVGYRCQNNGNALIGGLLAPAVKDDYCQYRGSSPKFVCMYGGQVVTATSNPYYYVEPSTQTLGGQTPVNTTYKCIKNNGYNVGVRCITDSAGEIVANYNMEDKVNCPLSAPPVPQVTAVPQPQTTSVPVQPTDTQVAPTAQPVQPSNCDISKFSGYNCGVEGWNIGDCKTDTNRISRICGCDPNNTWISYPILYEVNKCP